MRKLFLIALGLAACVAWAAPRESAEAPAPDEMRGLGAVKRLADGEWIQGDWALKMVMTSGKGQARVSVPVEMIGGWTEMGGRWQRVRLQNGRQWLIKGIAVPTIWELTPTGEPRPLGAQEKLNWVDERISMNWEIFSMGFLNWPQLRYLGVQKVRARWCDAVELSGGAAGLAKARVWVDVEFGSPVEAELYDSDGRLVKTVRAVSVQKVDEREWILKRWEAVDAVSHAKVSVDVTAVALGIRWSPELRLETSPSTMWTQVPAQTWRNLE